jgi:hypothetical protein
MSEPSDAVQQPTGASMAFQKRLSRMNERLMFELKTAHVATQVQLEVIAACGYAAAMLADELVVLASRCASGRVLVIFHMLSGSRRNANAQISLLSTWLTSAISIARDNEASRGLQVNVRVIFEALCCDEALPLTSALTSAGPFFTAMNDVLESTDADGELLPCVAMTVSESWLNRSLDEAALAAMLARAHARGVRFFALYAPTDGAIEA